MRLRQRKNNHTLTKENLPGLGILIAQIRATYFSSFYAIISPKISEKTDLHHNFEDMSLLCARSFRRSLLHVAHRDLGKD